MELVAGALGSLALMRCVTLDKSLASLGNHHLVSKWNSSKCGCVQVSGLTLASL